jgi:Carboxypeptidase regulatory-like domain
MECKSGSKFRSIVSAMVLVGLLGMSQALRAQTSNAQLSGLITDPTGAVIGGAAIKAVNVATNVPYTAVSDGAGIYVLQELLPGPYTVTVTAPGFGDVKRAGLVLGTGDHLAQNFVLKPGTVAESVTVTGAQTLISSDEASTADVLDNKMITELPQLNRDVLDLTATVPSIQGAGPQVDQVQSLAQQNSAYLIANTGNSYSVSGGQVNGTFITVDGNPVQEAEFNNTNRAIPTPDSIGEFRVESGVLTADQGRYAGGIISMQTQSGTNTYHGRAFIYLRNQDLNSNDWTDNSLGNARQDFQQKNYGFAGGGPVRIPHLYNGKDHMFVYGAWEGQRFSEGQEVVSSIPTILNQEGNFSQTVVNYSNGNPVYAQIYDPFYGTMDNNAADCANTPTGTAPCWVRPQFPNSTIPAAYGSSVNCGTGLTCPLSGQSSLFAHYMALWPQPNHAPAANSDHVNNRYDQITLHTPVDKYFLRIDDALRPNHHVMGTITRSMMTVNVPPPFTHAAESTTTDEDWLGAFLYTWTPGSRTVVNFRLGVGVTDLLSDGVSGDASLPDPNINTSTWGFDPLLASNNEKTTNEIPPVVNIGANANSSAGGYTHVGGDQFDSFITQTDNGTVSMTHLFGRHTLKAGYEQYFTRFTEQGGDGTGVINLNAGGGSNQYWNQNDGETGSQLAELMMGSSNFYSWGNWDITPFGWNQAAYVMDDWKVNTKLTVQIGLRWDHDGARQGRHPQGSLLYDMTAKNVLTANSGWNWGQVTGLEPGLSSLPMPAWLSQGATGRVALIDSQEYPQKNLYTTNLVNLEPRIGINWAVDDKTVVHLSAGSVDQGLNGLSTDYMSFYYNTNTFNQISTTDGMHWISELGSDHGLRSFPSQPGGGNLGWVPPLSTNQQYWNATYGGAGNLDQTGTTINHYDTPTDYMWGLSIQRELGKNWAITGEYQGIRGVHLLTNVWGWSLNNIPPAYYSLGAHLNDQVPDPFYGQSQIFSAEPTVSLSQLLALSPQYGGTNTTSPGETTWGKSISNFANFQIQSRNYHGLELLASYAIRKTLTNASSTDIHVSSPVSGGLQNPHNLMEGYGPALYELPQTMKVNYSYDLPFGAGREWMSNPSGIGGHVLDAIAGGWAVAGISTWNPKGTPVLVPDVDGGNTAPGASLRWSLANDNYKRSGASLSNALVINGAFANSAGQGVLNASSFTRTPDYTFGNTPVMFRNLRNPGGFYTDASILKKFYMGDDKTRNFELRLEAQNILNHPVYGDIIADPDNPAFGGINGKTGQRVMQAGLRFFF